MQEEFDEMTLLRRKHTEILSETMFEVFADPKYGNQLRVTVSIIK